MTDDEDEELHISIHITLAPRLHTLPLWLYLRNQETENMTLTFAL